MWEPLIVFFVLRQMFKEHDFFFKDRTDSKLPDGHYQ